MAGRVRIALVQSAGVSTGVMELTVRGRRDLVLLLYSHSHQRYLMLSCHPVIPEHICLFPQHQKLIPIGLDLLPSHHTVTLSTHI